MVKQNNPFEEHAYRESLENEDEVQGTPAPAPRHVWLWIAGTVVVLVATAVLFWGYK